MYSQCLGLIFLGRSDRSDLRLRLDQLIFVSNGNRANRALSENRVLRASQENQHRLIDIANSIVMMQQTSSTSIEANPQTGCSSTTGINGTPNSEQYAQEVQLVHSHDRMNNPPAFSYSNSHQFAPRANVDNKFDEFVTQPEADVNHRNMAAEALEDWHRVYSTLAVHAPSAAIGAAVPATHVVRAQS